MKILVCTKVVNGEINPFDESAIECALRLSNDVTVISMGPKSSENTLVKLTRLGVKVILITDPVFAGSDTLATSYILSEAVKKLEYDLIFCGRQSIDGDTAQVGPMLSEKLHIPLITNVLEVSVNGENIFAKTRYGDEETKLPVLLTMERGYILRFPSIFSKPSQITYFDNGYLNCDTEKCGLKGSPTRVLETFENEKGKRKCKFIKMSELDDLISELQAKEYVKGFSLQQKTRLKSVWAVGEEVLSKAKEIADEVILINSDKPDTIARRALEEKPSVILWDASPYGRKNAPVVAAMLQTGLCADCTHLETDGENLIMYRPALSGNIIAKIKCLTTPQMATVRTLKQSGNIMVSAGRGVKDSLEKLKAFALKHGADIGASRGLVDLNLAPYENQVGLTGKMVSPKIYIAVGISGAVHHTVGIENAEFVVAINPDKNARIFDYADYGILEEF